MCNIVIQELVLVWFCVLVLLSGMNRISSMLFFAAHSVAEAFARLFQVPQDDQSDEGDGYHLELAVSIDANLVLYFENMRPLLTEFGTTHVVCDSAPYALTEKKYNMYTKWEDEEQVKYWSPQYFKINIYIYIYIYIS